MSHLNEFSIEGFRTLCLAQYLLDNKLFEDWQNIYRTTGSEIQNRVEVMTVVTDQIERDLILLGATATEENFKDDVPKT